eukprot:14871887-Alexandrium_andersonii.AAC.2
MLMQHTSPSLQAAPRRPRPSERGFGLSAQPYSLLGERVSWPPPPPASASAPPVACLAFGVLHQSLRASARQPE